MAFVFFWPEGSTLRGARGTWGICFFRASPVCFPGPVFFLKEGSTILWLGPGRQTNNQIHVPLTQNPGHKNGLYIDYYFSGAKKWSSPPPHTAGLRTALLLQCILDHIAAMIDAIGDISELFRDRTWDMCELGSRFKEVRQIGIGAVNVVLEVTFREITIRLLNCRIIFMNQSRVRIKVSPDTLMFN